MSNAVIDIAASNGQVFGSTLRGDVLIYTNNNTQRIGFGNSNNVFPPVLAVGSNHVCINTSNTSNSLNIAGTMVVANSNNTPIICNRIDNTGGTIGSFEAPSLSVGGNYASVQLGKNNSNFNSWTMAYVHQGENSSSNFLGFAPVTESYVRQLSFSNILASGAGGNTNKLYDYNTMITKYPAGTYFYIKYNNTLFRLRFNASETTLSKDTTFEKTLNGGKTWAGAGTTDLPFGTATNVEEVILPGYPWNMVVTGSNVGIGTTTPNTSYSLEVNSTMRVNSNTTLTPNRPFINGYITATSSNPSLLTSVQATGGMAITSSTRIVAPIAGVYSFGFNMIFQNDTSRKDFAIWVNGVHLVYTLNENDLTGHHYRGGELACYLNANDYVEFANPNSGTPLGGTWSTFWFFLVG